MRSFLMTVAFLSIFYCETKGIYQHVKYERLIDIEDKEVIHRFNHELASRIELTYNISFHKHLCCPLIFLYPLKPNWSFTHEALRKKCLDDHGGSQLDDWASFAPFYIYLKPNTHNSGCTYHRDKVVCIGKRNILLGTKVNWYMLLGYRCGESRNLNMSVLMDVELDKPLKCEEKLYENTCFQSVNYTKVVFPNLYGLQTQSEVSTYTSFLSLFKACYQHSKLFLCRLGYQECRDGELYIPCEQMCEDFMGGCGRFLETWGTRPRCDFLPDNEEQNTKCFYLPVVCQNLTAPENGVIYTTGNSPRDVVNISCNLGYKLEGSPRRVCGYSGKWNGTEPHCIRIDEEPDNPDSGPTKSNYSGYLAAGITSMTLILILIIVFIIKRKWLSLLFRHSLWGTSLYKSPPRKIFLTYSSQDQDDVANTILPEMKKKLLPWSIMTFDEDFTAGTSLIDSIHDAVWTSDAVVVLLTNNFIESQWCEYEFTQALDRSARDKKFKLIIVIYGQSPETEDINISSLPEHLKIFVNTRVYLCFAETLFWNKLRRSLAEQI